MIKSVGLDVVEIARIKTDIEKFGDRFIDKILGQKERQLYDKRVDKVLFLAGRFAAKEALIKGLGVYLTDKPMLPEIQVVNDSSGQPALVLADKIKDKLKYANCHISITHEKSVAAAVVIFSEE